MLEVGTKLKILGWTGITTGSICTVVGMWSDNYTYEVKEDSSGIEYGVDPEWVEEGLVEVIEDKYSSESVVEITATKAYLSLNDLCSKLHQENFEAGWWNDINTGEDMRSNVYFQASKLLLAHSELSEAVEALRKGLMDDKLPQYPGEAVELVDALIRIFEYCGMKEYDVDAILKAKTEFNAQRSDHKVENRGKQGGKLF